MNTYQQRIDLAEAQRRLQVADEGGVSLANVLAHGRAIEKDTSSVAHGLELHANESVLPFDRSVDHRTVPGHAYVIF